MALGTVWPPSSSDSGHNRSPSDTGDNSARSPSICGDRTCNRTGRERASTAPVRRDEWQNGAPVRVFAPRPRFPGGEYGGVYLLVELGRPATG